MNEKGLIVCSGGKERFEMHEHELPEVERGAILTKIRLANICGSDLHVWQEGLAKPGMPGGHEFVAEIAVLGEGVATDYAGEPVKVGDRIISPYYLTCMKCEKCAKGDFQNCENAYKYLGKSWDQFPYFMGAFSTHYYIYPQQFFYKVPDDLKDELVVGVNCAFSQVYAGIDKQLDIRQDETFLIQGAGGLGLYATAIANERGAKVIVVDAVKERLELAKRFGAAYTIDIKEYPNVEDRIKKCLEYTNGKGADKALEVCGIADAFEEGLRYLKVTGKYVMMGINVPVWKTTMGPGWITRKALTVQGVVRYDPVYIYKSMQFLKKFQDKYPFDEFCANAYPLDDIQEVMQQVAERKITRAILKP